MSDLFLTKEMSEREWYSWRSRHLLEDDHTVYDDDFGFEEAE